MFLRRRPPLVAALAVALLAGLLALLPTPAAAAPSDVFLAELHYDDDGAVGGADSGEAIEVQGPVGESIDGWSIVLYNGANGQSYSTRVLSGTIPDAGVVVETYPPNGIQNGSPDGVALVDAEGTVIEFLSYEGAFPAVDGPAAGTTSTDIGVAETNSTPVGRSLQKVDGAWTGPAPASFGTINVADDVEPVEPGVCTGDGFTHTIAEVQGTGDASPLVGQTVKVAGVVTADHRAGGFNGLYVQTEGTGGPSHLAAPGTASTAVFVYLGTDPAAFPDATIGDPVEVTGPVSEFSTVTQITAPGSATAVCDDVTVAVPEPTPIALPMTVADREAVEGMLVAPSGSLTVSDTYQSDRFGQIILNDGVLPAPIPTDRFVPGSPEALGQRLINRDSRIVLDDARTTDLVGAGELPPYYDPATPLRVGDRVDAFGPVVLGYAFDEWRLQPTAPVNAATPAAERTTFASTNPRPAAPEDVGGDTRVASFNVLNYFVHFGGEARGAANAAELAEQEAKIVSAIVALDADVVALQEIENSVRFSPEDPQQALHRLVAALNAVEGEGTWAPVASPAELPPAADQDVITGAIIYKPASVSTTGPSRSVDDESVWFNAREPIAQTFTAGEATFTVVVNHFKSKSPGTPPPAGDNADVDDGQGAFNGDRIRQAHALVAFVDDLVAESGSDEVLLFGDFNAYGQEDPMQVFYGAGYTDLGAVHAPTKPSYVFGGEVGSLDHALASPGLLDRVTGMDTWEINAHEAHPFQYDGHPAFYEPGPYRSSDHNPEIVGLRTSDDPSDSVELQLLGINDFHGRLEPVEVTEEGVSTGGAAQLAGLVDRLRAENPNTAFVSAGDLIGASTFISAVDDDNPTLDALNAAGLDVSAVGNHEFDKGVADLTDRVVPRAEFPYLGANVYRDGERVLDAFHVQPIDGIDVGYVGVVTEQTPSLVSPDGIEGLEFRDPVAEVAAVAADLKDGDPANGEADVVVLLAHEGAADSTDSLADLEADEVFGDFVSLPADVDVIFSAHTHREYALLGPVPGGGATDRPLVQTGEYGRNLGRVTLTVDRASGDVTGATAELVPVVDVDPVNGAVADIVDAAIANAEVLGAEVIGSITADILTDPTRSSESVAANFIADVQLGATSDPGRGGAQIALMNPGGVRTDFLYAPDGLITYSEAFAVQPFSNDVVTKTYTGAELKAVLEEQWQPDGAARPLLWLGVSEGFTYSYDPTAPQGSRILGETMRLDGVPIDPAGSYRVTVNSFLASGGDNFGTLGGGTDPATTGDNDLTMLVDHFRAHSPVTADPVPRTTVAEAAADVTVQTTASASRIGVDGEVTYTSWISTDRPATGVDVTVEAPAGTELVSVQRGFFALPCELHGDTATCTVATLRGETYVSAVVRAVAVGTGEHVVTASAATADPDPSSNTTSTPLEVVPEAVPVDLTVTTPAELGEVAVGDPFTYLVSVRNLGDQGATGVVVTDELPEGVEVVSATVGFFGRPCAVEERTVTCAVGTVTGSNVVKVTARGAAVGEDLVHEAVVTAATPDPDPANDRAAGTVHVVAERSPSDLRVRGWTGRPPVPVGTTFELTVVVDDVSRARASGVVVSGQVPAGLEVVSVTRGWFGRPCGEAAAAVRCELGEIGEGELVVVTVRAVTAGTHATTLTATGDGGELNPADNAFTTAVPVAA